MTIVTYAYVEGRFYIPVFFLLVALAVLPADWAVGQALEGRFSIWGVGVLAVFLLSCIGYPSQSGFEPTGGRSQAWDALHYANGHGKSLRYEAQKQFLRIFRDSTWHCFIRHRIPLFKRPTAEAICSCPRRR